MRPDGKPEGPRQSMSWLHTYSGLLLGWLLFAIFFTGTLSYFRTEVNDWMRPELHQSVYREEHSVPMALALLQERAPDASSWTIGLPSPRSLAMSLSWSNAGQANNQGRGGNRLIIDATSGEELKPRETRASGFFYRFHFELHGVTRTQGRLIVGIATLFMFVAIISGVITHKKIFTDFFTFRPKKGQRSWLDAHNATAVLALPFHIMITFSGLLLIAGTLLPSWGYPGFGRDVNYFSSSNNARGGGGERGAMQQGRGGQQQQGQRQERAGAGTNERGGQGTREGQGRAQQQGQGGGRGNEGRPFTGGEGRGGQGARQDNAAPPVPLEKAPMVSITRLLTEASQQFPTYGIGSITINNPGTVQAVAVFSESQGDTDVAGGGGRGGRGGKAVRFNAVSGELIEVTKANPSTAPFISRTSSLLRTLHEGRFAGPVFRWLLFLSGVLGTFMAASGMVLWVVKRMPERRKLGRTPISHRMVEILNIAAIAGLCIAIATLFWMNRLLPADMQGRGDWEIDGFFIAWLASAVHALVFSLFCTQRTVWMQQMAVAALMYALLPILNPLTGGASLLHSLWYGQWSILYVDLILLGMASMHGAILWWLLRKPVQAPAKAPRKAPKAAPGDNAPAGADGSAPAPVRRKPPKAPPIPAPVPALAQAEDQPPEAARRKPAKAQPSASAETERAPAGGLLAAGALAPVLQAPLENDS